MSILGRIAKSGSTVTTRRSVKTRTAGGGSNQSWTDVLSGVTMLFDAPDAQTMQRLFGQETKVAFRAMCSMDFDVQRGDGVKVTSGWLAGSNFQVSDVMSFDQSRHNRHLEIGLVSTKETF